MIDIVVKLPYETVQKQFNHAFVSFVEEYKADHFACHLMDLSEVRIHMWNNEVEFAIVHSPRVSPYISLAVVNGIQILHLWNMDDENWSHE